VTGFFRPVQVVLQRLGEAGQVQEVVLGFAHDRRGAIDLAAGINQARRVQQGAAVIALVAACIGEAADVTGAFHQAVGQEAVRGLAVKLLLDLLEKIAALQQDHEDVLGYPVVVVGVGMREQVVADADALLCEQEAVMVVLEDCARRQAQPIRLDRDRSAVRVRARNH